MKVLVACEESQAVCKAFREKGHEAYSCDIQECSGEHLEWHILGDVLPLINGDCIFETMDREHHTINGEWDLIIAHPPCTYLSNAGAARLYPKKGVIDLKRFEKGMKAKEFFMQFYNAKCKRICVENPIPTRIFNLPKYSQIIQPYEHGHPYSKKTCLWLKGLEELKPTHIITENVISWVSGGVRMLMGIQESKAEQRSVTVKQEVKHFPALQKQWLINGGNRSLNHLHM